MGKLHKTGQALIAEYRAAFGDVSALGFSRGKDSIACALAIMDKIDVVPIHYFMVPGLPFVEESLDYYERKLFKRRILRFPHPALYNYLNDGIYQTYDRMQVIMAAQLIHPRQGGQKLWYRDITTWALDQEGLPEDKLIALGVRARDNPYRWISLNKYGPIRRSAGNWNPIWNFTKGDVIEAVSKSGISLPIDYSLFGRSFDGLDARFLVPLKRKRPEDWKHLLEWYPLAELEIWKHERFFEGRK